MIAVSPTMKGLVPVYPHSDTGRRWRDRWEWGETKQTCVSRRLEGLTQRLSIPLDDALVLSEVI